MRKIRSGDIAAVFQDSMTLLNPVFTVCEQIVEALCLHTAINDTQARGRAAELPEMAGAWMPYPGGLQPHEFSGAVRSASFPCQIDREEKAAVTCIAHGLRALTALRE